jgi:hypothetical protein
VAARCRNALDQAEQALESMRAQARKWSGLAAQAAEQQARADALAEKLAQRDAAEGGLMDRAAELEQALRDAQERVHLLEGDLDKARREVCVLQNRRQEEQQTLQCLRSMLGDAESLAASALDGSGRAPAAAKVDRFDGRVSPEPALPEAPPPRLGKWLLDKGRLHQATLDKALEAQRSSPERLGRILVRMGAVTDADVAECLAGQFDIPFEPLNSRLEYDAEAELLAALPARAARAHSCIPLGSRGNTLAVAMANPQDLVALDELRRLTGRELSIAAAPQDAVLKAIERWYGGQS